MTGGDTGQDNSLRERIRKVAEALDEIFPALDAFFDLPCSLLDNRPSPADWTIRETLEHVSLANHYLLIIIERGTARALKKAPLPEFHAPAVDLHAIEKISDPLAFEWEAPVHMLPGRPGPGGTIRENIRMQGKRCRELLRSMPAGEGCRHSVKMSVAGLGKLDMYGWLYFLAMHAQRHLAEMHQLKEH